MSEATFWRRRSAVDYETFVTTWCLCELCGEHSDVRDANYSSYINVS